MENFEEDSVNYVNEYQDNFHSNMQQFGNFKRKPTNTLDFVHLNSEEYKKFALKQKVLAELSLFSFADKYIAEVVEAVFQVKAKIRWNLKELIHFYAFQVVKRNNLPISHYDFMQKTNLSISSLFKIEKRIQELSGKSLKHQKELFERSKDNLLILPELNYCSDKVNLFESLVSSAKSTQSTKSSNYIEDENRFVQKTQELVNDFIYKLINYSDLNPEVLKFKPKEDVELKILDQLSSSYENKEIGSGGNMLSFIYSNKDFLDRNRVFQTIKVKVRQITNEKSFSETFQSRILPESLSGALIKHFLEEEGLKINIQRLCGILLIGRSGVSKAGKHLKNYIRSL